MSFTSPTPAAPGSARPASVVNAEIRALWSCTDGALSTADEARYQELLVEWAEAVRAALVKAA
ncbi:hypothetical protein ACQPZG_15045 [Streptomyces sp. CA-294286]|uniref:hypothetical protein n=1 Tax=Streptomyces sp. CA-294286 TaxID=3240070 RepID=UPI003D945B33